MPSSTSSADFEDYRNPGMAFANRGFLLPELPGPGICHRKETVMHYRKHSPQKVKRRNPLARHPLMSKGGVHEKPRKAERGQMKREIRQQWPVLVPLLAT